MVESVATDQRVFGCVILGAVLVFLSLGVAKIAAACGVPTPLPIWYALPVFTGAALVLGGQLFLMVRSRK